MLLNYHYTYSGVSCEIVLTISQKIFFNNAGRPLIDYPDLRDYRRNRDSQAQSVASGVECGCMVVLRYWQLFHGKPYTLNSEKAREQVLM